ncbi:MAG: IS1595 family transposase [Methylovirgula sp.]
MASILNEAYFHDEEAAFVALEAIMWPAGKPPHCPHCGVVERCNKLGVQHTKPSKKNPDGKPVFGLWKCYACRKQFTVRKGTLFEESHLPLHQWFRAAFLLCSSKKGCSSNQLARTLGCTVKTAWFLSHRLREAMRNGDLSPLGGPGEVVEADETYFGDMPRTKRRPLKTTGRPFSQRRHGTGNKRSVVALVERGGNVRSFHPEQADGETVAKIVSENIHRESRLHTDESHLYSKIGAEFAAHETVKHSDEEYVRDDVTTNTVEGYFSIFKRGMRGIYQHCAEKHLHRYLAEFDFRYNHRVARGVNDHERTVAALSGARGKRLTYLDSQ